MVSCGSGEGQQLLDRFAIGIDTAAKILTVAGDNAERIRSEAAFAKLASISPVPTGSGKTSGRHRVNHGGQRQLNAAIYRTVIVRLRFHEPTASTTRRVTRSSCATETNHDSNALGGSATPAARMWWNSEE